MNIYAQDVTLKNGKEVKGTYAGEGEEDYTYYKVVPSKAEFIEITVKTSDKKPLQIDICNSSKSVIASDISIANNKSVLHKIKNKKTYFIRVKGKQNVNYRISYKNKNISALTYAKKYTYTFTNASFNSKSNAILFKVKAKKSGNLHFMNETENPLIIQYLSSSKKVISSDILAEKKNLSGIGVKLNKVYYIKVWNMTNTISGTTTIKDIKHQIDDLAVASNSTRAKSYNLSNNTYKESLVIANQKNTFWYKIKTTKKQKLSIIIESRMLQNNGSALQLDLYNVKGKKMTSKSVVIDEECSAKYKKKKYVLTYPTKKITTGDLPEGTYYVKIASNSRKSSGSFRIKWK